MHSANNFNSASVSTSLRQVTTLLGMRTSNDSCQQLTWYSNYRSGSYIYMFVIWDWSLFMAGGGTEEKRVG